jgi:TPR repeat protein
MIIQLSLAFLVGLLVLLQSWCSVRADETASLTPEQLAVLLVDPDVKKARCVVADPDRQADALALFRTGAERNNPIAEAYLGYLYYMGHGAERNDRTAADWYGRAAKHGFADAQLRLGLMYFSGRDLGSGDLNVPRDETQAEAWIRRAADGGSPPALDMVAHYLEQGVTRSVMTGVKPTQEDEDNFKKAMDLYQRAAKQNDTFAMEALCANRGFMVPVPGEINKWCDVAREQPNYGTLTSTPATEAMAPERLLSAPNFPTLPPISKCE